MAHFIKRFVSGDDAGAAIEYALIAALAALFVTGALEVVSTQLTTSFASVWFELK